MVLVDSSIFIRLQRRNTDPIAALTERFDVRELAICPVVRCEVLRGIVRRDAHEALNVFFSLLIQVTIDQYVWGKAEELAWELDRLGWILPLSDLLIGICALRIDAEVLTNDSHFRRIPRLRVAKF